MERDGGSSNGPPTGLRRPGVPRAVDTLPAVSVGGRGRGGVCCGAAAAAAAPPRAAWGKVSGGGVPGVEGAFPLLFLLFFLLSPLLGPWGRGGGAGLSPAAPCVCVCVCGG